MKKKVLFPRCVIFVMAFLFVCSFSLTEASAAVTDTLTIKVGYWGMHASEYVEKGTYSWSQLDDQYGGNLKTHNMAYSFIRKGEDGQFRAVIDSARGFYITDLLDYAGIDISSILKMDFYTKDQQVGSFTSFSYKDLFKTKRYYFNDLAAHVVSVRDENGNITGINADDHAADGQTEVKPMLALEDSWANYDPGSQFTAPNFTNLATSNRFRLLFGQTTPLESRTNQTAKYVHTIYVTFVGSPKFSMESTNIANKIGSDYKMSINVSMTDPAFIKLMNGSMQWKSSDNQVLEITKVETKPSEFDDMATVVLTYDIKKNGTATISGNFKGLEIPTKINVKGGTGVGSNQTGGNEAEKSGQGQAGSNDQSKSSGEVRTAQENHETSAKYKSGMQSDKIYILPQNLVDQLKNSNAENNTLTQRESDMADDAEQLHLQKKENLLIHICLSLTIVLILLGEMIGTIKFYRER